MRQLLVMSLVLAVSVSYGQAATGDIALSFDGGDDRVMVPYSTSFPTEIFSLSAWIKLVPPGHRSAIIARGEDNDSFNLSWQLFVDPSGILEIMLEDRFERNFCYPFDCFGGTTVDSCVVGDMFVADDLWHHVAATRDALGTLILYVDGQSRAICGLTATPSSNNFQFLTIGATHGTIGPPPGGVEPPTWFYPGLIDDPAMWNVPLTGVQILEVFSQGVNPGSPGLVGYWDFDEGSGQRVSDLSPVANHGFLGADDDESGDSADPQWVRPGGTLALSQAINGDPGPLVTVSGPLSLTLGMTSGGRTDLMIWFWVLAIDGSVFWITETGPSRTLGPLLTAPPLDFTNVELISLTFPSGTVVSSVFLLWDGAEVVTLDVISGFVQ